MHNSLVKAKKDEKKFLRVNFVFDKMMMRAGGFNLCTNCMLSVC